MEVDDLWRQHRPTQADRGGRRQQAACGHRLPARDDRGRRQPALGSVEPQHRFHHRGGRVAARASPGDHAALRRTTSSCGSSPSTGSPSWRRCRPSCSGCCPSTGPTPTPTTCRRSAGSGTSARPARRSIKQAWIDIVGPEQVWELYGGTELQALTFISGDQYLTHPGSVGVVVVGRDEGARRRRRRMPAWRRRRDLHAAQPGQRADVPLRRGDRQEPRRVGLARRPRLLRRPTASSI